MRSAMSPERSAWAFSRLESATRETPSAFAASVTVRSSGSRISVRMNTPGCGGFFIRSSRSAVVVLIVHLDEFTGVHAEREPPIARYPQAPSALPIAGQLMRPPARHRPDLLRGLHVLEERQHLPELVHGVGREAAGLVA